MRSERWLLVALLCSSCARFERGEPSPPPDASPAEVAPLDSVSSAAFAPIHAALTARCGACHVAGGAAAATALVLSGDVQADRTVVIGLVTPQSPDASPLLQKGAGLTTHAGGAALPPGQVDYELVRAWIAAGTPP